MLLREEENFPFMDVGSRQKNNKLYETLACVTRGELEQAHALVCSITCEPFGADRDPGP